MKSYLSALSFFASILFQERSVHSLFHILGLSLKSKNIQVMVIRHSYQSYANYSKYSSHFKLIFKFLATFKVSAIGSASMIIGCG